MFIITNIDSADLTFANAIREIQDPLLIDIFSFITLFGGFFAISLSLLLIVLFCKKSFPIKPLLISLAGAMSTTYGLKELIQRPRPEFATYQELTHSFPSGHTTSAFVVYGFIAIALFSASQKSKVIPMLFLLLAFLVGFSRVYLLQHYLSDVITGALIALIWLYIGFRCNKRR
jgi:undecaprenyl-diphosphatase